jgi:CubicO group peptidase (beta-lactamase class C family)
MRIPGFVSVAALLLLIQSAATPSARLDELLRQMIAATDPGAAVMVIKNGNVEYRAARGMADLDRHIALTPETPFYIASLGKQFTAVAIMKLAERGRLGYDDLLTKYFPQFEPFAPGITIRQVLTHTSGLPDHLEIMKDQVAGWTNDDVVKLAMREQRVLFAPGEKWSYSNTGYVLLAMIVEKVSGMPFARFAQDEMFRPLGMERTVIVDRAAALPGGRARGYRKNAAGQFEPADYDAFTTGAGGAYSTLDDLAKWDRAFSSDALIAPATLKLASTPAVLSSGRPTPYGFGWLAEFDAKGSLADVWYVASTGDFKGFKGLFKRIPERRFTVIVLANNGELPWKIVALAHELYAGRE